MKTLSKAMIFAALSTSAVFAQGPFGVVTSNAPPDPAAMVQNQVARLTSLLSLTTAQVSQATTIFTNAAAAITPIQTALNSYWTAIETAVKSNATATIDSLSASIGTATGQITDIQNKADAAFYASLTAGQQAKLNSSGGFGPGGGPGGGQPGPGPHM
ncbi:MAG TPA: Spy/CpxP family protein refolding chaperone [Bryobacteraceae bacterium]|nr:Spy/CpxP family protein refolding chaperone [Bryobacteraceae bacterium]